MDDRPDDLPSIDRAVARAWGALTRWRAALAEDPEEHAADEPLEPVRWVAGKSTWDALGARSPSAVDVPLRDALRRWVFALTLARLGLGDEASWEVRASQRRAPYRGEPPRLVSWREAWRGLVACTTPAEATRWIDAASEAAAPLAEVDRRAAARRLEAARRFGLAHPWQGLVAAARDDVRRSAARLLDATEDLWRAVLRERGAGAGAVLHAGVARAAGEGWPTRVTAGWLEGAFEGATRGLAIDLPHLPAALGAASFARALRAFGFAVRVALAPRAMPFALARAPAFVGAHRFGFAFGALAADAEWQRRVLGVGRRVALAQARILARAALLEARLGAARVLLGDDADFAPPPGFDEIGERLFGAPLDGRLRGAWPRARPDEPARWIGLLESRAFGDSMRDRFDTDWYRNPRAWAHLRGLGAAPADEPASEGTLATAADLVARAFERAVG